MMVVTCSLSAALLLLLPKDSRAGEPRLGWDGEPSLGSCGVRPPLAGAQMVALGMAGFFLGGVGSIAIVMQDFVQGKCLKGYKFTFMVSSQH